LEPLRFPELDTALYRGPATVYRAAMAYWILRSEPETYGWDDLVRDGGTEWDGVRNYAARNFLKAMQPGDEALFYHSGKEKAAVGVMAITRAWRPDGADGQWASVRVEPREPLARPVTLAEIKAEPKLAKLEMLRQSRLSVTPIRDDEWKVLLGMSSAS
jgi:predicted RNA-binding protein with PUA-like domain